MTVAERTPPHFLDPDPDDSTNCKVCGDVNGHGVLHLTETVTEPEPDNSRWQPGDVIRSPHTGDLFGVYPARWYGGRLEFVVLHPTWSQDRAPADAELLVRDGKAVCRRLGCGGEPSVRRGAL